MLRIEAHVGALDSALTRMVVLPGQHWTRNATATSLSHLFIRLSLTIDNIPAL